MQPLWMPGVTLASLQAKGSQAEIRQNPGQAREMFVQLAEDAIDRQCSFHRVTKV